MLSSFTKMITGYWSGAKGDKGESDHTAGFNDQPDAGFNDQPDASDDGSDDNESDSKNAAAQPHSAAPPHELAEGSDESVGSRRDPDASGGGRKLDVQHDADSSDDESASAGSRSSESDDSSVMSDASDSGREPDAKNDAAPLHTLLRWPSSNDDLLRETFGSDRTHWPSLATDARVVKFVLHQLYDPSKFDYYKQALRTKSGVAIKNRIDLARFCNESADSELLTRFDRACTSVVQNLDRLRLELDVGSFHLDESISLSSSQNDHANAKNSKGKDEVVTFDAMMPRGKAQVLLRVPGGTIVRARQTLLGDKGLPPNIKAQIAALPKHTGSRWIHLIGDKSKHPMCVPQNEEGDEYDSLPSERVRCLPHAFVDVIGYRRRLESKLLRDEPKGSLNVCDIRHFSDVVKRKLNCNLEHLKFRSVASDPPSHKDPNETWLTFFRRQATGKYLLMDDGHAQGIDCENKVIWYASRRVASLELLRIIDEKRSFARKVVYEGD